MSASGWETTRSAASGTLAPAMEEHRRMPVMNQTFQPRHRLQQQQQPQQQYLYENAGSPSRASYVARQNQAAPRHRSFAQPHQQYQQQQYQQQYQHHDKHMEDQQPRRRGQSLSRLPADAVSYRENSHGQYCPQQQQVNQFEAPPPYYESDQRSHRQSMPQLRQYDHRNHQYQHQGPTSPRSLAAAPPPPPYYEQQHQYQGQPPPAAPPSNNDYDGHHYQEVVHEPLEPPLPVRRAAGPLVPDAPPLNFPSQRHSTSSQPSVPSPAPALADDVPAPLDEVLLGKRWSVHVISQLYQFQRIELGDYAHELVKFLRGHALMTYEQEFGYNVVIRYTCDCIAFHVIEARDLHAEFLIEQMEQPQRSSIHDVQQKQQKQPNDDDDEEEQKRAGWFVVYFPQSAENSSVDLARLNGLPPMAHRRSQHSNGSTTSSAATHGQRGEPKYAVLVRGHEELLHWVSLWVQRRFQCVMGKQAVCVTADILRRVARNWAIESLERDERTARALLRKAEQLRKASGVGGVGVGHEPHLPLPPAKVPLLMKYHTKRPSDAVKTFTLMMPWTAVRRTYATMQGSVSSGLGGVPEVLEKIEQTYFGNLCKDLAAMELVGFQMEEVAVDTQGKIKFFKSAMVLSILQSFLDIFSVQQPEQRETAF